MINKVYSGLMLLALSVFLGFSTAYAADHVDAPLTIEDPQVDITDVYAFLDPNDDSQLVVAMAVNPFLAPADRSTGFGTGVLHQFKFDNTGDGVEDYVVQAVFEGQGLNQTVRIFASHVESQINTQLQGDPAVTGNTQEILNSGGFRVFAGLSDDAFVFDFTQFVAISQNATQDMFRGFTSPILGELRGREVGADGTSGIDFFANSNASHIVVSFPKNIVDNGSGFFGGLADTNVVGIWATTSRNGVQRERMGQQIINTVFVTSDMKDTYNTATPADDVEMFSGLIPDALTQEDTDGTGNTIDGRIAVLQLSGLTELPNGAPLLLPEGFEHPLGLGTDLLRVAILPDVIRLDLDRAPADQSIGLFGLQNGRRPQDDVADIGLALLRQLADVKFPDAAMVPVGEDMIPVPGSGPLGERAALDCSNAEFPQCADRRVLVVLQGTDFTTPDGQIGVVDLTTSGNDREFESNSTSPFFENTVFPFMAVAHEPATGSSSGCSVIPATANTGAVALGSMLPFLTVFGALGLRALRRKLKV